MAKRQREESDQSDSPETLPMTTADSPAENAPGNVESSETQGEPLPRWKIKPKTGGDGESIVQAATVEDAIRAYNGASTQFAAKQLIIEAL